MSLGHVSLYWSNGKVKQRKAPLKRLKREAATYIILRKKGYSINKLANLFGRSTSFVHRILKKVNLTGKQPFGAGYTVGYALNFFDQRKSGVVHDQVWRFFRNKHMGNILRAWELFMLGEGEKPP